jgi:hypothetical protein
VSSEWWEFRNLKISSALDCKLARLA